MLNEFVYMALFLCLHFCHMAENLLQGMHATPPPQNRHHIVVYVCTPNGGT